MLALVSKGGPLTNDADAQVDIALRDSTTVDAARELLVSEATGSWKATRVAESTGSGDEATVTFALPGSSLDGFVAALRRQPDARSVDVSLEIDPEQVRPSTLADRPGSEAAAPAPVRVQVNLTQNTSQGPMATFIGALLVAAVAALGLGLVWRRFRPDDPAVAPASAEEDPRRRWTNRP